MNPRTAISFELRERLADDVRPVMRAGIRRVWLQGRPVYEEFAGKLYAWWPDGRLLPTDGDGLAGYVNPRVITDAAN